MSNILKSVFIALCVLLSWQCDDNPYKQGGMYYAQYCANCHLENGQGLRGVIPPLAGADYLEKNRNLLPCIIRRGQQDSIVVNGVVYGVQAMPAVSKLTDFEIANILNFVNTSWGNTFPTWTIDEVRENLKRCP